MATLTMPSLTIALKYFFFVLSTILETIEDLYLFAESHFDRQRDFEKIDDFIDFSLVYGFKLLCSAVFVAFLILWTWYNMPLKRSSRRDLEAERHNADRTIQQLVDNNSKLQAMLDETNKDRNSIWHDYGVLATQNTILENRFAQLQLKPDLQPKCYELELELELSETRCFGLEESLARSKMLRQEEDSERKALTTQAQRAKLELRWVKNKLRLDIQCMKLDFDEDLAAVKKQRDRAMAAMPMSAYQLHKENKVKNDEVTLLKAALEEQKAKFEAQLAEQFQQIQGLKLDLKSEQLNFKELNENYLELAGLEQEEDENDAEPSRAKDEGGDDEITVLKISLDAKQKH